MSKFNPSLGNYFNKPQKPTSGASMPQPQRPVTRTVRPTTPGSQFGSGSFDPTYMLPQGGTYSAARPRGATGITGNQWNTPQGVLSKPGEHEDWWGRNKAKFDSPTSGERTMADASNIFRTPSNAQQLYASGNQGLNTHYQRELDKRQADLENRMAAMGVFGSGAMARSMYELQGELGASQARDMADLASRADQSELQRGQGLAGVGQGMHGAEMGRLGMGGSMSRSVQDMFQDRETMPLRDKRQNARDLSEIFTNFSTKTADEQSAIFNDIVQSIIAESGVDWQDAQDQAQQMFQSYGISLQGLSGMQGGQGAGYPPPYDPNGVMPGRTYG